MLSQSLGSAAGGASTSCVPGREAFHCRSVENPSKEGLPTDFCFFLQALMDAEDAEQMAAELHVLERQLSSLRNSVPEEADAAQEAKRQAKASVHQSMSAQAGKDASGSADAGAGLDEPAQSGDSDTSAFSGITDALLSNPKFSAGAEGGSQGRRGSDRCEQCCRAVVMHGEGRSVSSGVHPHCACASGSAGIARALLVYLQGWGRLATRSDWGPPQGQQTMLSASGFRAGLRCFDGAQAPQLVCVDTATEPAA